MREGGLDAPVRHPIDWQDPDFTDADKIAAELRRVFDICHGCRRCFNLCDAFPTLFDLIDESETGDPARRAAPLAKLGGVEETAFIRIGGATIAESIRGIPEEDLDRTSAAGKASAVQFVHFPFTDAQVAAFRGEEAEIVLGFSHPEYAHMAALPDTVRKALSQDFD